MAKKVAKKTATKVAKKVAKRASSSATKNTYELEVKVNDVDFGTKADSIELALQNFIDSPVYPFGAKTVALIKVKFGKKETTRTIPVMQARRTFLAMRAKDTVMQILAAQLQQELNE